MKNKYTFIDPGFHEKVEVPEKTEPYAPGETLWWIKTEPSSIHTTYPVEGPKYTFGLETGQVLWAGTMAIPTPKYHSQVVNWVYDVQVEAEAVVGPNTEDGMW